MSRFCRTPLICGLGFVLIATASSALADQVWTVTLDTSQLATNYSGPFALDFELVDTNGNTITLSGFSFGGGSAGPGPAFLNGGASGDLGNIVSLNDSPNFFSDFNQQFIPGATLSFTVDSTLLAPPAGGSPDNFSMVIFSAYDPVNGNNPFAGTGGTPIPTTDPTGSNTFIYLDVNGPGSTTATSFPGANGEIPSRKRFREPLIWTVSGPGGVTDGATRRLISRADPGWKASRPGVPPGSCRTAIVAQRGRRRASSSRTQARSRRAHWDPSRASSSSTHRLTSAARTGMKELCSAA
jgi:hypothetical protein